MSIIVLNFHGLGEPHAGVPADEKAYWLSYSAFNDLLDRIGRYNEPSRFAFTFDDGNASDLEAAEILASRGWTGRFFALAGRLGHDHYLSAGDMRQLHAQGMLVGLHGRDHIDWRACDDASLNDEIGAARCELEAALGAPIGEVAIPFGRYNRSVMSALRKAGFQRIHTSDGGTAAPNSKIWNRNTLRCDMPEADLDAILAGRWSATRNVRRSLTGLAKRHLI